MTGSFEDANYENNFTVQTDRLSYDYFSVQPLLNYRPNDWCSLNLYYEFRQNITNTVTALHRQSSGFSIPLCLLEMKSLVMLLAVVILARICHAQALSPDGGPAAAPPPAPEASSGAPGIPVSVDPNYLLQPDDVIEVVVFREADLTTNAIVRKDGMFEMKLLGATKVAGLSVDQATEVIRAGLAKDYLVSPRVSLSIVSYAKRKINVVGEVRTPGLYGYPEHGALMLSDAIAMAGGFLPTSDTAHVVIRRTIEDKSQTLEVNASSGGNGEANTVQVKPDDAITVTLLPKRHFTVLGQINRPGDYDVGDARPVYPDGRHCPGGVASPVWRIPPA